MSSLSCSNVALGGAGEPMCRAEAFPDSELINDSNLDDIWVVLLECSLQRTEKCRDFVECVARSTSNTPSSNLALVLLEEWQWEPQDPRLRKARRVWLPAPSFEEMKNMLPEDVEMDFILLSGTVLPNGTVEGVALLQKSQYEALNVKIIKAFSQARYRPPRNTEGQFISETIQYLYRIDPR